MGKSISAKAMSSLYELFPKNTAGAQEEKYAKALKEGEKPTPPHLSGQMKYCIRM